MLLLLLSIFLESSMLLTQLHFKSPTGAHLLLMEHQLHQLHFQHTPLEMWIHVWIQIFGLCVRCRLVLQWWPCCSTVCKVATARLLQTKIALSLRALPKLHGLHHQHSCNIKGLLSLLLTHHFLVMDVDCCLTCTSVIPTIIWLVALALGLFKSPFHICARHTNGLPRALSSALLLFHARPWKHLPQLRHSFCSKGPTPSLSTG